MSYSKEIIEKAKELSISYNYSYKKVAETLKIKRWLTVRDWCKKFEWDKLKERIDKKTIEITETELVETLSKSRARYKVNNVEILDLNKSTCTRVLSKLQDMLQADTDGSIVMDEVFMKHLREMLLTMNQIVGKQDEMLFGKTSIDFSGDLNINADEVIKATIDYLDATASEEHDLDIQPDLPKNKGSDL